MPDDEYEILPHQELDYLRKEVARLKSNPFGDTETGQTLLDSMNNLTAAINKLLQLLETANDEIVRDYHETKTSERLNRMMEQNEKLAQGIVAVGEMVNKVLRTEKKNLALQGGLTELSDFTTDIKKVKSNKPHKTTPNPFAVGVESPASDITLDSSNLPRQSFSELDPGAVQSGAKNEMPPSFADDLAKMPPPTSGDPGNSPISDDEIPSPPK